MCLAGDITEVPLADVIQLCATCRRTGMLVIHHPHTRRPLAQLSFDNGELHDAQFGGDEGSDAVYRALELTEGEFRFDISAGSPHRRIHTSVTALLLEGMRRLDEGRLAAGESPITETTAGHRAQRRSRLRAPLRWLALAGACAAALASVEIASSVSGVTDAAARLAASSPRRPIPPCAPAPRRSLLMPPVSAQGVTDTEIVFGMTAALSGPNKEYGRQMRMGVEAAFGAINAGGGVHGRRLRLVAVDDGYEPKRTVDAMRQLIERERVFGFVGSMGTPTIGAALPIALSRRMVFFGGFSGADLLRREPPDRYVFNLRASYAEELAAVMNHLVKVRRIPPGQIAVFAQQDAFGDAGYAGVTGALRQCTWTATRSSASATGATRSTSVAP